MTPRKAIFAIACATALVAVGQNVYRDGRLISGPDARWRGRPGSYGRGGYNRGGYGRGGWGWRNDFPQSSTLHQPWAGSDTYEKNKNAGRERDGGRSDFQRDRDSTLDVYHREEDRARAIRERERDREERRQTIRENKAAIDKGREAARREREAREQDQLDEIRYRAAEKERKINDRHERQAEDYDKIMRDLGECRAYNADGTPCTKKANPGIPFCHRHVGYTGEMKPAVKSGRRGR